MSDCLFCKIVSQTIPAIFLYEDEHMVVFKDKFPKADIHLLAVPKKHIHSLMALESKDANLMGHMMVQLKEIAKAQGLEEGFRTVINTGANGGQEIFHLHIHLLGGSKVKSMTSL